MTELVERRNCPVCSTASMGTVYSCAYSMEPVAGFLRESYAPFAAGKLAEALHEAEFALDECGVCGLVYQRWAPGENLLADIYGEWAYQGSSMESAEKRLSLNNYAAFTREIMTMIAMFDRPPWSIRALEYGMGWGFWARMAKAFGVDVWGIEVSGEKVERAAGWGILAPDESVAGSFDYVNADQVMEHLHSPLETMKTIAGYLRPGGIARIGVPDGSGIKEEFAGRGVSPGLNLAFPLLHLNVFNESSLRNLGKLAGLTPYSPPRRKIFVTTNWTPLKRAILSVWRPLWRKNYWGDGVAYFIKDGKAPEGR
ncbi:MAG: class I SAM-dependent methyltransferase [Nitrospinae bacterium]|nr:class I SAM-dependent methyltransferase [Nitrospinota bacterium]